MSIYFKYRMNKQWFIHSIILYIASLSIFHVSYVDDDVILYFFLLRISHFEHFITVCERNRVYENERNRLKVQNEEILSILVNSLCFCIKSVTTSHSMVVFFLSIYFRSLLEQHMHCHREMIAVRVFDCPEPDCLFSGRSAAELRVHQSTHSTEKNFCCTIPNCGYKTKTNALLNR